MYALLFLALSSCGLSLLLTPMVRNLARRWGLVDQPDQRRKLHPFPVPRLGGVAIAAAVIGSWGLLSVLRLNVGGLIWPPIPAFVHLLPAGLVIFTVGLWDDVRGMKPVYKLSGQVLAAVLAWYGGIHLHALGHHALSSPLGLALTVFWIVACTNAINLIDGVDGLAAGVALFATITTLIAALMNNNYRLAMATVPIAGALLGFLRFNFNPASIFLGDCGSLTLGFMLGCYAVVWGEKPTTLLGMTAPLLALSVPLFDAALAIVRRFLRQQPIFGADRSHIHHKLLARGLAPRHVALVLYGICGLAAAASLLLTVSHEQYRGFIIVLVCLSAWLGVQHLGYNEFGVARRLVLAGGFRRLLNAQLALGAFQHELVTATTVDEVWDALCQTYTHFGFSGMTLVVDGEKRYCGNSTGWYVHIEIADRGYIRLSRESTVAARGAAAVPFVDCLSSTLCKSLDRIETRLALQ